MSHSCMSGSTSCQFSLLTAGKAEDLHALLSAPQPCGFWRRLDTQGRGLDLLYDVQLRIIGSAILGASLAAYLLRVRPSPPPPSTAHLALSCTSQARIWNRRSPPVAAGHGLLIAVFWHMPLHGNQVSRCKQVMPRSVLAWLSWRA